MARHKISCTSINDMNAACNCGIEERRKAEAATPEITDEDLGQIASQIVMGYTSGRLDSEDGKKISWSITMEVWKD